MDKVISEREIYVSWLMGHPHGNIFSNLIWYHCHGIEVLDLSHGLEFES